MTSRSGRRPRVLVLRTSRFVGAAVAAARLRWPDAIIRVASQPGTESELDAAGIDATSRFVITTTGPLSLGAVLTSAWGWRARLWRPDQVVLQWWDERGHGHEAADRAALWLQPRGFQSVLQDGSMTWQSAWARLRRPIPVLQRRAAGVLVIGAIAVAAVLLWPSAVWCRWAGRRRLSH